MGLDMYLQKIYMVSPLRDQEPEVEIYLNGLKMQLPDSKVMSFQVCVGYWRKAYAIDLWFNNNLQLEHDDPYSVNSIGKDKLKVLLRLCNEIWHERHLAPILLPYQDFGELYEYDDYFYYQIEQTKDILEKALEDVEYCESIGLAVSFQYHRSS